MNKQSIQIVLTTLLVVLGVGVANAQSPIAHESAKLLASDGASDDRFGWCVAIDGNLAIIGAYREDENGTNSGSA
ncbi:MAG: FG-GAP repeat protein, partial [Phycisphaerales bacterium]|nr:FG-GAP repeat protein [Phycisphaerales bacterium]